MDDLDERLLKEILDIPLTKRPFAEIANKLGIEEKGVIARIKGMMDDGIIRQFRVCIAHRRIGIRASAMCMWNVPGERVDEVGKTIASFDEVTHCYERSNPLGYNMFTMVHGYTEKECEDVIKRISDVIDIDDYIIMFSERELKR
jgi:DNA-binding Lrp family transcriptional regulator